MKALGEFTVIRLGQPMIKGQLRAIRKLTTKEVLALLSMKIAT